MTYIYPLSTRKKGSGPVRFLLSIQLSNKQWSWYILCISFMAFNNEKYPILYFRHLMSPTRKRVKYVWKVISSGN